MNDGPIKRLLFVVNDPSFFISHRLPIALAARAEGWEVHVATPQGKATAEIQEQGFLHHVIRITRSGKNPLTEITTIWSLIILMRFISPDIAHLVTIKPVLYGGIAARIAKVRGVVAAISGLGSVFTGRTIRARILRRSVSAFYRIALGCQNIRVVFQNPDDESVLIRVGAVKRENCVRIRGSGVNLRDYPFLPEPAGQPVISFAARLLVEKGVITFVNAARLLKERGIDARFWLIGSPDHGNPSTISERSLIEWKSEGIVEVFGFRKDIPSLFAHSNLVVLPSYYGEGLPKVLIEAAACGRAVITTDHPGCRDAIVPGKTGLLINPRDAEALASTIDYLVSSPKAREAMGRAGRKLAKQEFSIQKVVQSHIDLYHALHTRV